MKVITDKISCCEVITLCIFILRDLNANHKLALYAFSKCQAQVPLCDLKLARDLGHSTFSVFIKQYNAFIINSVILNSILLYCSIN